METSGWIICIVVILLFVCLIADLVYTAYWREHLKSGDKVIVRSGRDVYIAYIIDRGDEWVSVYYDDNGTERHATVSTLDVFKS